MPKINKNIQFHSNVIKDFVMDFKQQVSSATSQPETNPALAVTDYLFRVTCFSQCQQATALLSDVSRAVFLQIFHSTANNLVVFGIK